MNEKTTARTYEPVKEASMGSRYLRYAQGRLEQLAEALDTVGNPAMQEQLLDIRDCIAEGEKKLDDAFVFMLHERYMDGKRMFNTLAEGVVRSIEGMAQSGQESAEDGEQ